MEDRKDLTVPMPKWMKEEIEEECGYGSRSAWIRDACLKKLRGEFDDQETDE
jgi:Arc/MetJ-type ribon-helix-helix transcriptional regulator